jgi:hypothetical protein
MSAGLGGGTAPSGDAGGLGDVSGLAARLANDGYAEIHGVLPEWEMIALTEEFHARFEKRVVQLLLVRALRQGEMLAD